MDTIITWVLVVILVSYLIYSILHPAPKTFTLTLSGNEFRKGDLLVAGNKGTVVKVVSVNKRKNTVKVTVLLKSNKKAQKVYYGRH
jgi:hypothetical protein